MIYLGIDALSAGCLRCHYSLDGECTTTTTTNTTTSTTTTVDPSPEKKAKNGSWMLMVCWEPSDQNLWCWVRKGVFRSFDTKLKDRKRILHSSSNENSGWVGSWSGPCIKQDQTGDSKWDKNKLVTMMGAMWCILTLGSSFPLHSLPVCRKESSDLQAKIRDNFLAFKLDHRWLTKIYR